MRTLVDLKDSQVRELDRIAKRQARPRAALIREAIDDYLSRHDSGGKDEAFGLWARDAMDGLAFQEAARGEW